MVQSWKMRHYISASDNLHNTYTCPTGSMEQSSALTFFACWHVCTRTLIWRRYICKLSTAWGTLEVFNELVIASTRAPPRHVAPFVAILLKAKRPNYPTESEIRYSKHRRSNECNVDLRNWPYSPGHVATRRKRVMKSTLAVTSYVMSEVQEDTRSLQCCHQLMKNLMMFDLFARASYPPICTSLIFLIARVRLDLRCLSALHLHPIDTLYLREGLRFLHGS